MLVNLSHTPHTLMNAQQPSRFHPLPTSILWLHFSTVKIPFRMKSLVYFFLWQYSMAAIWYSSVHLNRAPDACCFSMSLSFRFELSVPLSEAAGRPHLLQGAMALFSASPSRQFQPLPASYCAQHLLSARAIFVGLPQPSDVHVIVQICCFRL